MMSEPSVVATGLPPATSDQRTVTSVASAVTAISLLGATQSMNSFIGVVMHVPFIPSAYFVWFVCTENTTLPEAPGLPEILNLTPS